VTMTDMTRSRSIYEVRSDIKRGSMFSELLMSGGKTVLIEMREKYRILYYGMVDR